MYISPNCQYLVTNGLGAQRSKILVHGGGLHKAITPETKSIEQTNTYEIYTDHPITGESGWEIELVHSTDDHIRDYPNFDCIITRNDHHVGECVAWFGRIGSTTAI